MGSGSNSKQIKCHKYVYKYKEFYIAHFDANVITLSKSFGLFNKNVN